MTARFLLTEGLASVRRVPAASMVGALVTGLALAIVGGFLLVASAYRSELERAGASATVEVILDDSVSPADAERVSAEIDRLPGVVATDIRTPREGAELFGGEMVEDTAIFAGGLPLPTTVSVRLSEVARTSGQVAELRSRLDKIRGVSESAFPSELLSAVEDRLGTFMKVAVIVGSLLLLGVVGAAFVTAQLTLVTRRSMIGTMRLLGAERRWILAPFLIQGSLIGLVGGLLASLGLYAAWMSFPGLSGSPDLRVLTAILASPPAIGLLLGLLGSTVAGSYYVSRTAER